MLKIKYPKFILFLFSIIIACFLFQGKTYPPFHDFTISLGYFGSLLTGMLFAYGFTTIPATAIFLVMAEEQSIFLGTLSGGFGAMIGNLIFFRFIRNQFSDELERLSQEKMIAYFNGKIPKLIKKYLVPVLAGIIIVLPIPSEIGISILATLKTLDLKIFLFISYMLNSLGIFIILLIGSLI